MLSWKEYPRSIGGLAKYLSWFKEFKRPSDLHQITKDTKKPHPKVSLFGSQYEKTGQINALNIEQGTVNDNYFLTVLAALSEK